jgi:hypothetical protein
MRYKIDRLKMWLRNKIANYLERKIEKLQHDIKFKKPLECYVWVIDRNWDHDCVEKTIYGLSDMTMSGYARPSDIDELGDIIKILFKVLFFGTRR